MSIPGIYLAIIGLGISSIAGIIGIFNLFGISIEPFYLLFSITIGAIISLIGMYSQYKESEIIRIKIVLKKEGENIYKFSIPYNLYRKKHPSISLINSNYEFCWGFPYEITKEGTLIFTTDHPLESDMYILIK